MSSHPDFDATVRVTAVGQTVFGRSTLERIVGRGGMGVVWLAQDRNLELPVALKFLPDLVRSDPEALRDLRRETKRALRLTHENIVRIYTLEEDAGSAAIVMEYVDGQSLAAWKAAQTDGCLEPAALLPIVRQLCAALTYAHETAGVVTATSSRRICCWPRTARSRSRISGSPGAWRETQTRLTGRASATSGTLLYMSPQQLMGEKPTPADDIYSLGATLYELLTSKLPFYTGDVFMQVRGKVAPRIEERRREFEIRSVQLPLSWERVVGACLSKSGLARPKSATAVLSSLQEHGAWAVAGLSPTFAKTAESSGKSADPVGFERVRNFFVFLLSVPLVVLLTLGLARCVS